jgi:Na+/glutamate symporter
MAWCCRRPKKRAPFQPISEYNRHRGNVESFRAENMSDDEDGSNSDEPDYERRTLVNLLAAVFLICLALAAAYVITTLDRQWKLERCIASGRRDCAPLQIPPNSLREPVR